MLKSKIWNASLSALCCIMLFTGCTNSSAPTKKEATKLTATEMETVKEGDKVTFKDGEVKEYDQEYLESKDLIAIYSFTCNWKKKDGTTGENKGYSVEATMDPFKDDEVTAEYIIDGVEIKKIHQYSFGNVPGGLDPVGGAIAPLAFTKYYNANKEKMTTQRFWQKVVVQPEGWGFVPVLSEEKIKELDKKREETGENYFTLD